MPGVTAGSGPTSTRVHTAAATGASGQCTFQALVARGTEGLGKDPRSWCRQSGKPCGVKTSAAESAKGPGGFTLLFHLCLNIQHLLLSYLSLVFTLCWSMPFTWCEHYKRLLNTITL